MIAKVNHISSRCGAGKSQEAVRFIYELLDYYAPEHPTVVFASKTNELSKQNHQAFEKTAKEVAEHASPHNIQAIRIDSETHKGRVTSTISDKIACSFQGALFTSHAILGRLEPELLEGAVLVIDEIPSTLIETLSVRYEATDSDAIWESYVLTRPSSHEGYEEAYLNPSAEPKIIKRIINNIRSGKDNTRTPQVADLLDFLLEGYETLYTRTYADKRDYRYYQAIHWLKLRRLVEKVTSLTVLCAQLKDSLFGFVVEHCLGLQIHDITTDLGQPLETHHKNNVRIVPFLIQGSWSSHLKKLPANEALLRQNGMTFNNEWPVIACAQQFAIAMLKKGNTILALNNHDTTDILLERIPDINAQRISTAIHGLNNLSHNDHAIYLASNRPAPYEVLHLELFAKDHNACPDDLKHRLMVERCYENAYQCIARTSIRALKADMTKQHIFVVPDMHYARYLATWFEHEDNIIDERFGFRVRKLADREDKATRNRKLLIQIRRDFLAGIAPLEILVIAAGITLSKYKHLKRKHHAELKEMRLLQTKSKKSKPIHTL